MLGDKDGEELGLTDADGDKEGDELGDTDGEDEGLLEGLRLVLGDKDGDADGESEGDTIANVCIKCLQKYRHQFFLSVGSPLPPLCLYLSNYVTSMKWSGI